MMTIRNITSLVSFLFFVLSSGNAQWLATNGPYGGHISCFVEKGSNVFTGTSDGGIFISADNS